MRLAEGTRDENEVWHPADPSVYTPMDVHGALPWSVLRQDSREWQERKRWWTERGVDDIAPRAQAGGMISSGRHGNISGGVSKFDPHLAEVLLEWFAPKGGRVLDPFAGGPVRGLVATDLGYQYTGIDLMPEQVAANRARAAAWGVDPRWVEGDALTELDALGDGFDFVLSCPPYHNRERYSDDPRDLSAMRWPAFLETYRAIIGKTVDALADDRFIAWVTSDVRDSKGHLRSLPAHTVTAFEDAGAHLTNEFILVGAAGLGAKAMRPPWEAARTTRRRHQIVHVFVKGDRRKATERVKNADR